MLVARRRVPPASLRKCFRCSPLQFVSEIYAVYHPFFCFNLRSLASVWGPEVSFVALDTDCLETGLAWTLLVRA